jgi:hypothetical protein
MHIIVGNSAIKSSFLVIFDYRGLKVMLDFKYYFKNLTFENSTF